jgi:hypothetical protein
MRLLGERLSLHDVDDVEQFAWHIIERSTLKLVWHEREDLCSYLVATAWELSRRQDDSRGRFSNWLGYKLAQRCYDWERQRKGQTRWKFGDGRVYERERPTIVSLDDSEHDRLGEPVGGSSMDDGSSGLADELRALGQRARRPGRGDDRLGEAAA